MNPILPPSTPASAPARTVRARIPVVLLVLALCAGAAPRAAAQCSYPPLADDTPQVFTTSPSYPRFDQTAGRWAAVAVRSAGTANWDVGISLASAAFPTCVTLPVVASQQTSGIDFVVGDFAAEGTGTRYAPIARAGGTGSATVEWDSGSRTALVGQAWNLGTGAGMLIDCWNTDLVAGTSYRIHLFAATAGAIRLYVVRRAAGTSWRQKSDALAQAASNSGPSTFTAPATDRYALVAVNESGTTDAYYFSIQPCTDPPDLQHRVSQAVLTGSLAFEVPFQVDPAVAGFATVAARVAEIGDDFSLNVAQRTGPGFYPCDGTAVAGSSDFGPRVELVVGDFASGVLTPGPTYWIGVIGGTAQTLPGRIEFDQGDELLPVDTPVRYVVGGPDIVARTFRADLVAGTDYRVHVARCGPADTRLYVFRPFDTGNPSGGGWSALSGSHAPLVSTQVPGVNDFTFTPPVTGPYAFVLTNESASNVCWEIGISTCRPRTELADGVSVLMTANPILSYHGQVFGSLHGRFGWSAVAVRPLAAGEDWVVEAWDSPSGGDPAPSNLGCLWGPLGASTADAAMSPVDFLARYDLPVPSQPRWIETGSVYPATFATPGGGALAEFEMFNHTLAPGEVIQNFPTQGNDVIEVWNIALTAGQPYAVEFEPDGFTGELFVLHASTTCTEDCPPQYVPLGGSGQVLRTSGPIVFTPGADGLYGLIVVNQDGGTGQFRLSLGPAAVDAEAPPPGARVPRLHAASPNPATGATRFRFELAREAQVGFEVVNPAGRVVARVPAAPYAPGRSQAVWDGAAGDGRRVAPGLYFVRMRVDGAPSDRAIRLLVL